MTTVLPSATEVVIIGGGIAGVAAASFLSQRDVAVTLVERELTLAAHTTGRSAAMFLEHYGGAVNRRLTVASRSFFDDRPGLLRPLPFVTVAPPGSEKALAALIAEASDVAAHAIEPLDAEDVLSLAPCLRRDEVAGGFIESAAAEIDVMALHQAFVDEARRLGASIVREAGVESIGRIDGGAGDRRWRLTTTVGAVEAATVVNAAGAWGDAVAALAGVAPVGLTPMRRTICLTPAPPEAVHWPMLAGLAGTADQSWYFKPETGGQLLCSPADETTSAPCDARPEELDIALALDRINAVTNLDLRHVRSSWAGLRTFAADRQPVIGWDPHVDGFFWAVGQGGAGIQTAPAAGRLTAALLCGDEQSLSAVVSPTRFSGGTGAGEPPAAHSDRPRQ